MKKLLSIITVCLIAILSFNACSEKIKSTNVSIKQMTDSTLLTIIDDHQVTFDYKQATFDNGFVMAGDSAVINYIGSLSDDPVKAVLIKLISKKGHVMNAVYDPNKKLETAPMTKEEEKELEEAIEFAKKHQPKKNK